MINKIFEDESLLIISKPAGIVVNRSDTQKDGETLQDLLSSEFAWSREVERNGIVHRLDKDTSGILIIAKNNEVMQNLQSQFKARKVAKKYKALVFGQFGEEEYENEIIINAPIGRNPRNREKFAIVEGGRDAETIVKPMEVIGKANEEFISLVECFPKTGRTHQIRVHLTAINHPVCGDLAYSGKIRSRKFAEIFKRQMLNASYISFTHPSSNESVEFNAPLPEDMTSMIDSIKDGDFS